MTLGQKQRIFSLMIAKLVVWAYKRGYELTEGDSYRDPRLHGKIGEKKGYGHASSYHKKRLAKDFNLFIDGKWQRTTAAHEPIGKKWESMGGTWGGRFTKPDGNHYSYGEKR